MRISQETIDALKVQGINVRWFPEETYEEFKKAQWEKEYKHWFDYSKSSCKELNPPRNDGSYQSWNFETLAEYEQHIKEFCDRIIDRHCSPYEYTTLYVEHDGGQILVKKENAKSVDKTDIRIILHDRRTKINSEMGFSIKSQLGGDSTLLNASKATNFNFKIYGTSLSDEDIAFVNSLNPKRNKVIDRVNAIKKKGGTLVFDKVDNQTFRNNLIMLDGDLPPIIASLLLEQLNSGISTLKELAKQITETNPLGYDTEQASPFYAYKIKHLLTSAALGMMPATAWNGKFDANGGYLVVKKDGEILCYHFYDRNRFEDYLFSNAYLERSSTTRHEYALVIKEDDNTLSFKLNFQVRLK